MTEIEEMHQDLYHNVSDVTLEKVKRATADDQTLQKLSETIAFGFPSDKIKLNSLTANFLAILRRIGSRK